MIAFGLAASLGAVGLILAGGGDQRSTAFSIEVQSVRPVVTLRPAQRACQGPIAVPITFAGVEVWVAGTPVPGTTLQVTARETPDGKSLAAGQRKIETVQAATPSVRLRSPVASGIRLYLCFANAGREPIALLGSTPGPSSGSLSVNSRGTGSALSIVLLRPRSSSLLSSLPTSLRRAALFRPGWVGSWTFWLLVVLVVLSFPLGAAALALAVRASRDPDHRTDRA